MKKIPVTFITPEEQCEHINETISYLSNYLNYPVDKERLKSLADMDLRINYNVGKFGRGFESLSTRQLDAIEKLVNLENALAQTYLGDYLTNGFEGIPYNASDVIEAKHNGGAVANPLLQLKRK